MGKGSKKWLVGLKYKITKVDQSVGDPSNVRLRIGDTNFLNQVVYGSWEEYAVVRTENLTRVNLVLVGYSTAPQNDQVRIEVKNYYIYDVTGLSDDMINLIKAEQSANYQDGTVTYGEASETHYHPDDTLSESGKAADSKAVGDALSSVTEAVSDFTFVKNALEYPFIVHEGKSSTLSNAGTWTHLGSFYGLQQESLVDRVLTCGIKVNNTEKNPYMINAVALGNGNWLVGFKYKLVKLDQTLGDPSSIRFHLGATTQYNDPVVYDEWVCFNKTFEGDLTRVRFALNGYSTAPHNGQLQFIIKDLYIYDISDVENDMVEYIMNQQNVNYQDGTVKYTIPGMYETDDTLALSGKVADSKTVGDAISYLSDRVGLIEEGMSSVYNCEFLYNGYINNEGSFVSSQTSYTTDYIPLDDAKAIAYTGKMGSFKVAHWFTENKVYISSNISSSDVMQWYINVLRSKPDGAKYVRLSSKKLTAENPPTATPEVTVYCGNNYSQVLVNAIVGDGVTDDTMALQRLVNLCENVTLDAKKTILISSQINVDLRYVKVLNGNGAKVIVNDDFYAFLLSGSLTTSSNPNNVSEVVMGEEAATKFTGFRITSSDGVTGGGIETTKAFKLYIVGNYIYKCYNGIRVFGKCRDLLISENNVYAVQNDCLLFDQDVDLHQCNIVNNMLQYAIICLHIYNPHAIANFQIDSNDIEISTYPVGYENAIAVMFESNVTPGQFSEIEMCGNTIQGHASSEDVIRFVGDATVPITNVSITGNHISNSSKRAMWLENCLCIAISSNTYKDVGSYLYEMDGTCENIAIVGDVAYRVHSGKIHALSTATLTTIICKHTICMSNGNNNIETTDVTNVDITD